MESVKVLVIDDEKNILESIRMVLDYEKYQVELAGDGISGIERFRTWLPDIVLLDVKMPGLDGLQVLKTLKEIQPFSEVIMISGHSGIDEAMEASRRGAFDFLEKPLSRDKLLLTVRNAADKVILLRENFNLKSVTGRKYELVGQSPQMREVRDTVQKVARSDSTVLITGESGTGKELIAREIHRLSLRRLQKFVQVNCAAIPEELIESELFGHEKGSFTGAHEKKIGKFEGAHLGSIFLDEVGDLSLKAQAKALRVLEEGEVQPVGSTEIKRVNVRVIAATNKDLLKEISRGRFREDLFFRLNVVPLHSPPLRQRREDIPLLIEHFLTYFSEENNYRKKHFSPEAVAALQKYEWQGNVRELRNLIERLIIMGTAGVIDVTDLPPYLVKSTEKKALAFAEFSTWKDFKQYSEKVFLEEKLRLFDNNVARTARELDIPRSNLYKKMTLLGIMPVDSWEADEEPPSSPRKREESPDSAGKDDP